jgi:hypothetical protein
VSRADWDAAFKTLSGAGLIPASADPSQYYTNELLDTATISRIGSRAK